MRERGLKRGDVLEFWPSYDGVPVEHRPIKRASTRRVMLCLLLDRVVAPNGEDAWEVLQLHDSFEEGRPEDAFTGVMLWPEDYLLSDWRLRG